MYTALGKFLISIIGAALLSLVLRWYFVKFGRTHSNRKELGNTFVLLATSIALIIYLIKSSITLSLGLVGALSIVRFRAAIKEPEELVYLLCAIAIGLGFGAEQQLTTAAAVVIILFIISLTSKFIFSSDSTSAGILTIKGASKDPDSILKIVSEFVTQSSDSKGKLQRCSIEDGIVTIVYGVESLSTDSVGELSSTLSGSLDEGYQVGWVSSETKLFNY